MATNYPVLARMELESAIARPDNGVI